MMFSKKIADVKKSTLKIQDAKKDLTTRFKHLKIILENSEQSEAKGLFETNFSHIYHILYDTFLQAETNLRQRVHKAHKEELEAALWILEQVLCLLPELIHKRWQIHSLSRILSKLLHVGNSIKLRRQAVRYFLMWYQALNENAPNYVHDMFKNLVPGINCTKREEDRTNTNVGSIFHDLNVQNPISSSELLPILPPSATERHPEQTKLFLDTLLENMVVTVVRLDWHDKNGQHLRCFHFLLEMFKVHYLPKLFPNFNYEASLYAPNLELPTLRKSETENEFIVCRVSFIKWITNYMHQTKRSVDAIGTASANSSSNSSNNNSVHNTANNNSIATQPSFQQSHQEDDIHESNHPSLDSTISLQSTNRRVTDEELYYKIVRDVLCNSRDNVNFLHEIYRQAFLLNFNHSLAIRKTIAMYKDLIQSNMTELPSYVLEPPEDLNRVQDEENQLTNVRPTLRLRNDSYLGAIHKENLIVRAGMQNILQLFMTHAANVFLLEVNQHLPTLLEEQTDACKRVLNIYRYMVMHTRMDNLTWEQLLLVLLQITSLVLGEPPKRKQLTLGGKLAPAIFQTLIVTWIKANLNVLISRQLWDRFLHVLTSLTNWEELITEWAKTMETLTRVLARHVYNLDLTDLPLDRIWEQKNKRVRKNTSRGENIATNDVNDTGTSRKDSNATDSQIVQKPRSGLARSYSETNINVKRKLTNKNQSHKRRSVSLDNLRQIDTESTDRTRSPSPAPSSGIESSSMKDSPIPLDVLTNEHAVMVQHQEISGEHRGIVCGGTMRGWVPDGAVILWKRMLGALGDVNLIDEPKHHAQVFDYLVKLTDTLIKIKLNQGVSPDNLTTPSPPELIPPLTLILPWCFGALSLANIYENGKLSALRLLCTIMLKTDDNQSLVYLPHFYRSLHLALTGNSRSALYTTLKYLGPHFLSLQLPGSSLLLLDLIQACNTTLNSSDYSQNTPRTEAVSILGDLLSFPDNLNGLSVLQPDHDNIHVIPCPDVKEHVVNILLRTGRREPTAMARCVALSSLGMFVYKELMRETYHPKVIEAMKVILLALKVNNKTIAQLASNTLLLLCDYAKTLWSQYPRVGDLVIRTLCSALFFHSPLGSTAGETDKSLGTNLLLCLGEWCMSIGPMKLLETNRYDTDKSICLLLSVFDVLHKIIIGKASNAQGLTQPSLNEDFDPNILHDNVEKSSPLHSPTKNVLCQQAIVLCAQAVLSHLINHLGHFPMSCGAQRLSSLVVEHDDVPNLTSDELSVNIFTAPNIQLFVLTRNVIASLIELPALKLPGGGVTAGLSTADKQVRVLLRDLSGKACWDASILYKTPQEEFKHDARPKREKLEYQQQHQPFDSLMIIANVQQRAFRQRPSHVLPDVTNAAPDLDQLHDLLQYIGHTSPECLENADRRLNEPSYSPITSDYEQEAIANVINERNVEFDQVQCEQHRDTTISQIERRPSKKRRTSFEDEINSFQQCRLLFSQLGLSGWERRPQMHLLNKTERLIRELRNLDTQRCRETHKVAIIYVGPGQEDKNSILSNQGGSASYEQFLASLAWEIELEGHTGFLGGLQRQGSNGLTAPYVATSFLEAIFHVATRMPSDTPEAVLNKTRHLGNDEVHVVWSEHSRDYRRDIIPTEFCDVLITIYPLGNQMNRVTLNCKPEVPYFGVIFNEAIVETNILAGLIRSTVICASRSKRTTLPFYQQYYEERSRSLETVVTKHREITTYEDFIARVYSPTSAVSTTHPFYTLSSTTGSSLDNVTNSSTTSSSSVTHNLLNTSNLANALIDSHGHLLQKSKDKFRGEISKGVWFHHQQEPMQNVESTSISPRPLKKLSSSLKNVPRRSLKQDTTINDTPPDSPPQVTRKK